tara:strand:- start:1474 stop:1860 length:387 start_codon:yes stop_codon:yes gene_type:complete
MTKTLVPNSEKYWEFLRNLRNHSDVKKGFINQKHITTHEHAEFMKKYGHLFYICLVHDAPAGYVGVIDDDIRVATHPDYQGKGIGKFMIEQIMIKFPNSCAKIKVDNNASLKLFKSCGFKKKYYILEK